MWNDIWGQIQVQKTRLTSHLCLNGNVGLERSWALTVIAGIPWQDSLFLDLFCATCGTAREASALTHTCGRPQPQQASDDMTTLFCWLTSCKICKKDHRSRGIL